MINPTKFFKLHQTAGLSHPMHTSRRTTGYWLAGLASGLALLANLDAVGGMLEEVIPILLELAEKGSESFFEIVGLSPRLAQGVTAYVGFTVALILSYGLACKVQRLTQQSRQMLADLKAESRDWINTTASTARTIWTNLPWHKKSLLAVAGSLIFAYLAMALSTTLGLAVAAVL